jgi:hypothetical protein
MCVRSAASERERKLQFVKCLLTSSALRGLTRNEVRIAESSKLHAASGILRRYVIPWEREGAHEDR